MKFAPLKLALPWVALALLLPGLGAGTAFVLAQMPPAVQDVHQPDPSRVVGHNTCAECHGSEIAVWSNTPHSRSFDSLHRTPEADAITNRLGVQSMKREQLCSQCHYTQQMVGGRERPIAGVSCESCHGGAQEWLKLHADYGGANVTRETESPQHRQQRRQRAMQAGMNNPSNLYLIARQCVSCHTVPNERLVDVGGHPAGSDGFELVAWSQGTVRHNFVRSGRTANRPSSQERLRVMYVIGIMADLEASLRATAIATQKGNYARASAMRAAQLKQKLWQVQQQLSHPLLDRALRAVGAVELKLNNGRQLNAAADAVAAAAYELAEADGTGWSAIDNLLPSSHDYK